MVILQGYISLFLEGWKKHHLQSEASKMMSWFNLHLTQGTFMAFSYTSPATMGGHAQTLVQWQGLSRFFASKGRKIQEQTVAKL